HLELEAAEQQAGGVTADEARYRARRAFGNVAYTKEEGRTMWSWNAWTILMQDFRYALRNLRKSPGFAITAFLTLALGIGASTAVFTLVDSVLLKPLAYRDSGRLVAIWERIHFLGNEPLGPNPRHADVWRQRASSFAGIGIVRQTSLGVTLDAGHPNLFGGVL